MKTKGIKKIIKECPSVCPKDFFITENLKEISTSIKKIDNQSSFDIILKKDLNKQEKMISKEENYLVIGASNDTSKYGYKVFNDLISNGYRAIPINPKEKKILKQKVYNNLLDFKGTIDNVIFVTQPKITETIIQNIIKEKLKVKNIWMQPGSENEKSIYLCNENNLHCTSNSCIMIERRK